MNTIVKHFKFGTGTVTNFDGRFVTVNFNGEEKKLLAKMANLTDEKGKAFTPKVEARVWSNVEDGGKIIRIYFGEKFATVSSVSDFKLFVEMNDADHADIINNKREILNHFGVNCLIVMNKGKHIHTHTYR